MKKFLALYLGTAEDFAKYKAMHEKMKKTQDKAGMDAWMKWAKDHEKDIVDHGTPVGKTKRVDKNGISDVRNEVGAWTVVQAESHEAAAKMFENHPHFMIFPGKCVEVMECLPMPKM